MTLSIGEWRGITLETERSNTDFDGPFKTAGFVLLPITCFRPGEVVVLSSTTSLIGVPEAPLGGVCVRALLNSLFRIGCLVEIAKRDIR